MKNSMFGILEKMDRYSNKLMGEDEKINFIQEIVDLDMVWDMHSKYIGEALTLIGAGKVTSKELVLGYCLREGMESYDVICLCH